MTVKGLEKAKARETLKYEVAKAIRQLLDQGAKQYGEGWDEDEVLALVTEEDE